MELLTGTNATLCANFRAIKPRISKIDQQCYASVEFEFWDGEKNEIFNTLIASTLFPPKKFIIRNGGVRTYFILNSGGREQKQIRRIQEILAVISMLTSGNQVQTLLRENGDPRFMFPLPYIKKYQPDEQSPFLNQYMNPSFLVTSNKLYRIRFSSKNIRSEEPLFCASPIFNFVGEPAVEFNPESHRAQAQSLRAS